MIDAKLVKEVDEESQRGPTPVTPEDMRGQLYADLMSAGISDDVIDYFINRMNTASAGAMLAGFVLGVNCARRDELRTMEGDIL